MDFFPYAHETNFSEYVGSSVSQCGNSEMHNQSLRTPNYASASELNVQDVNECVVVSERLLRTLRGPSVPVHCVAGPRRARQPKSAAHLHATRQSDAAARRWTHCRALQVLDNESYLSVFQYTLQCHVVVAHCLLTSWRGLM